MGTWIGCYEPREGKARFVPHNGQPETVWPGYTFHPDIYGGWSDWTSVTGRRHDVLARDNPAWAPVVLEAAGKAGMPLTARRIGSAGKYRFWRLCAETPAQAEADSRRLKAERAAADLSDERRVLMTYHTLPTGYRLVGADGVVIPAIAASLNWRGWSGGQRMLLVDGTVAPAPSGAALHDQDGREAVRVSGGPDSSWGLTERLGADHQPAPDWWWEEEFARIEAAEQAALDAQIAAARAAKAARKAASQSPAQPAQESNQFAALATLRR